jgi:hypothetical protein
MQFHDVVEALVRRYWYSKQHQHTRLTWVTIDTREKLTSLNETTALVNKKLHVCPRFPPCKHMIDTTSTMLQSRSAQCTLPALHKHTHTHTHTQTQTNTHTHTHAHNRKYVTGRSRRSVQFLHHVSQRVEDDRGYHVHELHQKPTHSHSQMQGRIQRNRRHTPCTRSNRCLQQYNRAACCRHEGSRKCDNHWHAVTRHKSVRTRWYTTTCMCDDYH